MRLWQNGRHFADDTFRRIFLSENLRISLIFHWSYFPKGPINNIPALVQIMAWRRVGDKPLSEPMLTQIQWRIYALVWFKYIFLQLLLCNTKSVTWRWNKYVISYAQMTGKITYFITHNRTLCYDTNIPTRISSKVVCMSTIRCRFITWYKYSQIFHSTCPVQRRSWGSWIW